MDPDLEQIQLASDIGADRIELYTGPYAAAWGTEALEDIFQQHAGQISYSLGLGVNAGHDLNLIILASCRNRKPFRSVYWPRIYC